MTASSTATLKQRFDAAKAQLERGDVNGAAAAFDELGAEAPEVPAIALMQGMVAARLGFHDTAVVHLTRADTLQPNTPEILRALVKSQEGAGHVEPALSTYDVLIRLVPNSPEWYSEKALYLQRLGRFDAGARMLRRAIKKMPDQAFMYRMLTVTEKLKTTDPLVKEMRQRIKSSRTSPMDRIELGYALSKVMADNKKYDQVFSYLHISNATERSKKPFKFEDFREDVAALIDAQDVTDYPPRDDAPESFKPIFLIGTPRSGTTLLERVLGAHKHAQGIGESGLATRGISVLMGQRGSFTKLTKVELSTVDAYRRAYERHALRQVDAPVRTVVDKTMNLYWIMGALRYAMPGARFVVLHRDPRDVAVSMYRNTFFAENHRYTNDLGDIARYIHEFRRGVAYWKDRLPEAPHEVQYEDFVADPEAQTRALLDAVGLPWDDACLRPHEAGGTVKTLSLHQVRQPIYQSSARGWTRYADDLKPFDDVWDSLNAAE